MDCIEGLPKLGGKDVVLAVVDRLTKFAHCINLIHPFSTQEVARKFMDSVVKIHEVPKCIVSDRDKIFTSVLRQELFRSLGLGLHMSTAYHPQTDSQTERVN